MKDELDKYEDTIYTLDLNKCKYKPSKVFVNGIDYTVGFEWLDRKHNRIIKIEQPFDFENEI